MNTMEDRSPSRMADILRGDAWPAAALFIVAVIFSMTYLAVWTEVPEGYWQGWWLMPSAALATGHSFGCPEPAPKALNEFLNRHTEMLPTGVIPANTGMNPPNYFHKGHRYLLYAVALAWWIFGVSWKALLPLYGVLCGMTILSAYALFRLGMNRFLAVFFSLVFLISPAHLHGLPLLRDYGKVPFMLAALFLMGYAVLRPMNWRCLIAVAAALGAVIGVGRGFRMDVLICLPAAMVVLAVFLPGNPRTEWKRRIAAVLVMLACFIITAGPILLAKTSAKTSAHHVLGGFVEPHDVTLGIGVTPYTWMPLMNDLCMFSFIEAQARLVDKTTGPMPYESQAYQDAGKRYFFTMLKYFPGDMITRAYASVVRLLQQAPMSFYAGNPDFLEENLFINRVLGLLWPIFCHLGTFGPFYAVVALIILSAHNLRLGFASLFLLLYFGGYSCLQFAGRHYFHLAVLPLWAFGFSLTMAVLAVRTLRKSQCRTRLQEILKHPALCWTPSVRRATCFTATSLFVLVFALFIARLIQEHQVKFLYERYANANLEPVPVEQVPDTPRPGMTLLKPKNLFSAEDRANSMKDWQTYPEVLVVELDGVSGGSFWFWPRYTAAADVMNFTYSPRAAQLFNANNAPVRRFIPVFDAPGEFLIEEIAAIQGGRTFEGLAVLSSNLPNIKNVYRVQDPGQLAFIMELTLTSEWKKLPWHQTMQPYPLPAPLRAYRAACHNLITNGGMERWPEEEAAPAGFYAPNEQSHVTREEAEVGEGDTALRQTWDAFCQTADPLKRFHFIVSGLEPDTVYELFVKGRNLSQAPVVLDVWQVAGQGKFERISPHVLDLGPSEFIKTKCGQFKTKPGTSATVLFSTFLPGDTPKDVFPLSVIWDDWRLVKAPDYGEVRRW